MQRFTPFICRGSSQTPINDTLDRLIVATVNMDQGIANHAMVIWKKSRSNTRSNEVELFNPGNLNGTRSTVDLNKKRITAKWNTICAAFLPGTVIAKDNASSPIEI